jgi:hypothetical protein
MTGAVVGTPLLPPHAGSVLAEHFVAVLGVVVVSSRISAISIDLAVPAMIAPGLGERPTMAGAASLVVRP